MRGIRDAAACTFVSTGNSRTCSILCAQFQGTKASDINTERVSARMTPTKRFTYHYSYLSHMACE